MSFSSSSFSVKVSNYQQNHMLNICDPDLLEKTISDGKKNIKISKRYYGEKIVDESEAEHLLKTCSIINMAGKQTVSFSLKLGIGVETGIKYVNDVPFLIIFQM